MRGEPRTVKGTRPGIFTLPPRKDYVYRGSIPLEDDPDIHRSMKHGTASAARLHYLRGEKRCDKCAESERARWREAKARRQAAKEAEENASSST